MRRPIGVKSVVPRFCSFIVSPQPSCRLSPPLHPHSFVTHDSLGASWVFSFQPTDISLLTPIRVEEHVKGTVGNDLKWITPESRASWKCVRRIGTDKR